MWCSGFSHNGHHERYFLRLDESFHRFSMEMLATLSLLSNKHFLWKEILDQMLHTTDHTAGKISNGALT